MADEINRASPRTQAALLQSMQEYHVTIAGQPLAHRLYHFVLAYSGWEHVAVVLDLARMAGGTGQADCRGSVVILGVLHEADGQPIVI